MATKDQDKLYGALADPASIVQTPNTVSRNIKVGDRAFTTGVQESGKLILDSELQLHQDTSWWEALLLKGWQTPSGWLRGQDRGDSYEDYYLGVAPLLFNDSATVPHIINGAFPPIPEGTLWNAFILPRLEAVVAGHPVVVEYTNTSTEGGNLVVLETPPSPADAPPVIKRTDFAFLEVWLSLVGPSPLAYGTVTIEDTTAITAAADHVDINGTPFTAVAGAPGAPGEFQIVVGDEDATALNLMNAINALLVGVVTAAVSGAIVTVHSVVPGLAGNAITLTLTVTVPGCITISGAGTLTGGADRPNKPDQASFYRHGNVLSPVAVALPDEFLDSRLLAETSQRVQVQYRIRVTGATEAVNYKVHPDGFSNPSLYAQGAGSVPVVNYPFVPANRATISANSSAVAYGIQDDGLWVAGEGTTASAQALGTVDGFVYAIPLCFVFRHNNASDPAYITPGFGPAANANGAPSIFHLGYAGTTGPVPAGLSDRPDGLFCDVIDDASILDLRRHVVFPGQDFAGEVNYQIQSLLDGTLKTWAVDTADKQWLGDQSGDVSTNFLVCNEIGRTSVLHGNPLNREGNDTTSGDTKHGICVRNFDHIARRFADQPVVERVVFSFYPGDRNAGPVVAPGTINAGKFVTKAGGGLFEDTWYTGDLLVLDLSTLDATGLGGLFDGRDGGGTGIGLAGTSVSYFAPPGTVITDILSIYHDDGHSVAPVDQSVQPGIILGLGTTTLTMTLDSNVLVADEGGSGVDHPLVGSGVTAGSARRIFVEVEITYPLGMGSTDTPTETLIPDITVYPDTGASGRGPGPKIENDITQRPQDFEAPLPPRFREGYRELQLEYTTNNTVSGVIDPNIVTDYVVSRDATTLFTPRRIFSSTGMQVVDQAATPHVVNAVLTEFGSSSRLLSVDGDPLPSAQHLCQVDYRPQDPIPNYGALGGGYQVSIYYRANAPQTAGIMSGVIDTDGGGVLATTLQVEPLLVGNLLSGQTGMGSVDVGFPYSAPLDQIPVHDTSVMFPPTIKEWYFCATSDISVADFDATTGLLTLHSFVQADAQNIMLFGGSASPELPPRADAEFRAFYPMSNARAYRPTVMAQPLTGMVRHKVIVPILARATEEVTNATGGMLYRKNELLLIVLSRFASLDDDNSVRFVDDPALNKSCAALYRTRNLLLTVGDRKILPNP